MKSLNVLLDQSLSPEQVGAISRSIRLGLILQQDHPEIIDLWKQDNSYAKIAEMLEIKSNYGVSNNVANSSVRYAIAGHDGDLSILAYNGIICAEERLAIARRHQVESSRRSIRSLAEMINPETGERILVEAGRKGYQNGLANRTHKQRSADGYKGGSKSGPKTYEEGQGIHGRTDEQMSIDGQKAGQKSYEQGKGIHSLTTEQRSELGRQLHELKRGVHARSAEQMKIDSRKGNEAQGFRVWSTEELEYAHRISQNPEFRWNSGSAKGKPNHKLIALELNITRYDGEEIRNRHSVQKGLSKYIKSLENN